MKESNKASPVYTSKYILVLLSIILIIVIVLVIFVQNNKKPENNANTNSIVKASVVPCSVDTSTYKDKVLSLNSTDFIGEIKVTVNAEKCRLEAQYVMVMKANLPDNHVDTLPYLYNYLGYLSNSDQTERSNSNGTGVINPAYVNKDKLPIDINNYEYASFYGPNGLSVGTTPTDAFYARFERWQPLNDEGYNNLFSVNTFQIIDAAAYMEKNSKNSTFTINAEKATLNGKIIKTYTFSVIAK